MLESLTTELAPLLANQLQPLMSEVRAAGEWRGSLSAEVESLHRQLAEGATATDQLRGVVEATKESFLGPRLLKKVEEERSAVASALSEMRSALSDGKVVADKHRTEKRVLQRALSDEKDSAVALLQERLQTQSRSATEMSVSLEELRGTHEAAKAQVQRQQTDLVLKQYELTAARERDKQLEQLKVQAGSDARVRGVLEEAVARQGVQAELLTKLAASLEASVAGQVSSHLESLEQLTEAGGEAAAAARAAAAAEARERATDARASAALLPLLVLLRLAFTLQAYVIKAATPRHRGCNPTS